MKLTEIVEPKPTAKELHDREVYADPNFQGGLDNRQVYVTNNQKDAFTAFMFARFREMDINPKHLHVGWASPRQATVFPPASVRVIVMNKKSEVFRDSEQAEIFPAICRSLIKRGFKEIFGFDVKVEDEKVLDDQYANGLRYLDFRVDWA